MSNDDIDKELNGQELTRVSNALDALQKHNNQPTTNAWEAIMEESTKRSRGISRRTQLLSAAAAVALILAVTGTALLVSSNGDNDSVKTVDKKKKEKVVTPTTVPLTEEQQLIANGYILKNTDVADNIYPGYAQPVLYDAQNLSVLKTFADPNEKEFRNIQVSSNHLQASLEDIGFEYEGGCYRPEYIDINLATLKSTINEGTQVFWSKDGKKKAELDGSIGCDNKSDSITISTKSGSDSYEIKSISKVVPNTGLNGPDDTVITVDVPSSIFWIDNNNIIISVEENIMSSDGKELINGCQGWKTLEVGKSKTLSDAKTIPGFGCGTDGVPSIEDVIVEGSQVMVLTKYNDNLEFDLAVTNITNGKTLWSLKADKIGVFQYADLMFGNTKDEVYGSAYLHSIAPSDKISFIYANDSKILIKPDGFAALFHP